MTFEELRVWAELSDRRRLREQLEMAGAMRASQSDKKGWTGWTKEVRRALGE